jgi:DNA-binding transcriptional ArsR family regulator
MVEHIAAGRGASLDRVFEALADPTRRALLNSLRAGPSTVTRLAEPFPVSLNAISKHLMVLERAGLIRREIRGREHRCELEAACFGQAQAWLERYSRFWETRLDALERHVVKRRKKGGRTR